MIDEVDIDLQCNDGIYEVFCEIDVVNCGREATVPTNKWIILFAAEVKDEASIGYEFVVKSFYDNTKDYQRVIGYFYNVVGS